MKLLLRIIGVVAVVGGLFLVSQGLGWWPEQGMIRLRGGPGPNGAALVVTGLVLAYRGFFK